MEADPREKKARRIQASIRRILLEEWDPIGVRDMPEARDEYDAYIGGIYHLLFNHAAEAQVINHLRELEEEQMGLSWPKGKRRANTEHLARVARELLEIDVRL